MNFKPDITIDASGIC